MINPKLLFDHARRFARSLASTQLASTQLASTQSASASFFSSSPSEPLEFSAWLDMVRKGQLRPTAPHRDSLDRLTAPLQFWAAHLSELIASDPVKGASLKQAFLAALNELPALGLPLDHFEPDRLRGHMSSSLRPLSHFAIGYDRHRGLGVDFLGALLNAGANPEKKDAFETPPLALCACLQTHDARDCALLLMDRGASTDQRVALIDPMMGGLVQSLVALNAGEERFITVRELAMEFGASFIPALIAREQAAEIALALRCGSRSDSASRPSL